MTNESAVSQEAIEITRKKAAQIESTILRKIADVTQEHAAACMGISASTVSRMKEDIGKLSQLLAAIGLRVTGTDSMIVDRTELLALESLAYKYLEQRHKEIQ